MKFVMLCAALFTAYSATAFAEVTAKGGGKGKVYIGNYNTPGWSLMTSEERTAHRDKMHSMKTYDECKSYHDEHAKQMEARAKEKGKPFTTTKRSGCDRMKELAMIQ